MPGAVAVEAVVEPVDLHGHAGEMLERARGLPGIGLLDSGGGGELGKTSLLLAGLEPALAWNRRGDPDPFEALRRRLAERRMTPHPRWPFLGGFLGWFGYGCRVLLEDLPERHPAEGGVPEVWWAEARVVAMRDERSGAAAISWIRDPSDPGATARARALAAELRRRLESRAPVADPPPAPFPPSALRWPSQEAHLARVARAIRHVVDGDVYQVNLAQRWEAPRPPDPIAFYRRLRAVNPPAFGALFETGGEAVLSVSPERFLSVADRRVVTRPIKGTAPRDPDPARDTEAARRLAASEKDRAELAMIVDVLRNDLSRVCVPGSVTVPAPLVVESHPTVHHLVAEVEGVLEDGRDLVDLLRATLPGGSVTGAPRIRAMEIIDALEACRRGPYCGALGWIGWDGRMDLDILIRTAFTLGPKLVFHGGGGIVADSVPEREYEETVHKVRGILEALAGPEAVR